MREDAPQPSINTFLDVVIQDPQFQKLPAEIQDVVKQREIDNPVDLLKDLRLRAAVYLNYGKLEEVKLILEFTQRLANLIGDNEIEFQISAWLALLEDDEKTLLLEVRDMIQAEIRETPEFKRFMESIFNKK